jgi:site-specific recombinase XerD
MALPRRPLTYVATITTYLATNRYCAAADADRGPQALRTAAVIRLLLHNALRVDEACAADLGADAGHRVLRVTRKGARKAKVALRTSVTETVCCHEIRPALIKGAIYMNLLKAKAAKLT